MNFKRSKITFGAVPLHIKKFYRWLFASTIQQIYFLRFLTYHICISTSAKSLISLKSRYLPSFPWVYKRAHKCVSGARRNYLMNNLCTIANRISLSLPLFFSCDESADGGNKSVYSVFHLNNTVQCSEKIDDTLMKSKCRCSSIQVWYMFEIFIVKNFNF